MFNRVFGRKCFYVLSLSPEEGFDLDGILNIVIVSINHDTDVFTTEFTLIVYVNYATKNLKFHFILQKRIYIYDWQKLQPIRCI